MRYEGTKISLTVRNHGGMPADVALGPGSHIVALDGSTLQSANVRLGDHLAIAANGQLEDLSQRAADLSGIVSVAADAGGSPMVVAITKSQSIVVDISPRTSYSDGSGETSAPNLIEDSDLVRLRGTLDAQLGEMTQTESISRLGPFIDQARSHSAG
jgi:hypothetical protein